MCAVCIPDGSAEVRGRLETQHGGRCLPLTRSPFSTFDSQLLSFHILMNSASVNPFGTHTSKKSHIYIKTMGFKSFRHTYLQNAFSQTLLNHILTKTGGGGEEGDALFVSPDSIGRGAVWLNHHHGRLRHTFMQSRGKF